MTSPQKKKKKKKKSLTIIILSESAKILLSLGHAINIWHTKVDN